MRLTALFRSSLVSEVRELAACLDGLLCVAGFAGFAGFGRFAGFVRFAGLACLAVCSAQSASAFAAPPAGVFAEQIGSGWNELVGVVELPDHTLLAWERGGRVWRVSAAGVRDAQPLIDISEEVLAWRDHGLLGLAIDPHFESNGHIYLAYVVDRHHLDHFGLPSYNPATTWTSTATIARITRYTADPREGFTHVHAESRHVLLGETREDGIPIVHQSHGIGSLAFGSDHTLMVTAGDTADYSTFDVGGQVAGGYVNDALAAGILPPQHNVGAYRSQLIDCINGKMLRLDAETGAGVPSNPYYDPAEPRAPRSRVWAIGLRNPFRMSHVPGTGEHLPSQGDPGSFVIADVGWGYWEEVNVCDGPAQNFGWPVFEGLDYSIGYHSLSPLCAEAPNPLGGVGGCPSTFRFRDLICQATQATAPWVNPCAFLQAEQMNGSQNAPVRGTYGGAQGHYYCDLLGTTLSQIEFVFNVPETQSWQFTVRYAADSAPAACTVRIDGVNAGNFTLPATGAPTEWRTASVSLTLNAGQRKIKIVGPPISGGVPGAPVVAFIDGASLHEPGELPRVPVDVRRGMHKRPIIDWSHTEALARTPGWNGGGGIMNAVGSPGGATGAPFGGYCAIAGAPIALANWPAEWQGRVWLADYVHGWVRAARMENGVVTDVLAFDQLSDGLVGVYASHDADALFVVDISGGLTRYRYAPTGNQPPVLSVTTSLPYGPSPHAVTLDASATSDPNGDAVDILWEFDDGSPSETNPKLVHVFAGAGGNDARGGAGPSPAVHVVHVTATDDHGAQTSNDILVWTDNTPPAIEILSPLDGQLYGLSGDSVFPLSASIVDAETPGQISCAWTTRLHHNTHTHPEPVDPACASSVTVSPLGCGDDTFWVSIELVATGPQGLSSSRTVALFPDCLGLLQCSPDLNRDGRVSGADLGAMLAVWGALGAGQPADINDDGTVDGQDLGLLLGAWGECPE